jgi:hypothetical protein
MLVKPATFDNEFLSEITDVGDRATEAGHAELREGKQHFERRT